MKSSRELRTRSALGRAPKQFVLVTYPEALETVGLFMAGLVYLLAFFALGPAALQADWSLVLRTLSSLAWSQPLSVLGLLAALSIAFQVTVHQQRSESTRQLSLDDRRVQLLSALSAAMCSVTVLGTGLAIAWASGDSPGGDAQWTTGDRVTFGFIGLTVAFVFLDASRVAGRLTWLRRVRALETRIKKLEEQKALLLLDLPSRRQLGLEVLLGSMFALGTTAAALGIQAPKGAFAFLFVVLLAATALSIFLAVLTSFVALTSVEMRRYNVVAGVLGSTALASGLGVSILPLARSTVAAIPVFWSAVFGLLLAGPLLGALATTALRQHTALTSSHGLPGLIRLWAAAVLSARLRLTTRRLSQIRASSRA